MKPEEKMDPFPALIKFPRFWSSIERRLSLLLAILMLVLITAGGLSLWLSTNVERSTRTMLSTFEQMDQPSDPARFQAVLADQASKINQANALVRLFTIAGICTGISFSLVIFWGARRTVFSRLSRLTADIEHISQTNFQTGESIYILQSQQDEIGRISQALGQMVESISEAFSRSEAQIQERTASLQRRSVRLDVASQVAREIAAARDLETLLYQAVNTIRDQFSFYHAGIFLIDSGGEYAILRAATGEAGQEMLIRGHRLKIGEVGLVGHVAQTGEPHVATDVSQDQVHFKNPLLPETRSEAALPLKSAGKVIGILDVQSREPDAFDSESMSTFQLMSDQLTVAIQNTRLFEESQKNFEKLRSTYAGINRQAWNQLLQTTRLTGFEFDGLEARPIYKSLSPGKGEKDSSHIQDNEPQKVSINSRGEQIAELNIWSDQTEISETDRQLLNRICNRLGQTLETARLFENAQRLASREQQINRITSEIRSSNNLETILQKTIREIGKSLGASRAFIQVGGILGQAEPESVEQAGPDFDNPAGESANAPAQEIRIGSNGHNPRKEAAG